MAEHGNDERPVVVCVSANHTCGSLLRAGERLAKQYGAPLEAVTFKVGGAEIDAVYIEDLYSKCKAHNAAMSLYYSDNAVVAAAAYIKGRKARRVVVGTAGSDTNYFTTYLHLLLPDTPITIVSYDDNMCVEISGRSMALSANHK